jgi:hypothetical protein
VVAFRSRRSISFGGRFDGVNSGECCASKASDLSRICYAIRRVASHMSSGKAKAGHGGFYYKTWAIVRIRLAVVRFKVIALRLAKTGVLLVKSRAITDVPRRAQRQASQAGSGPLPGAG